MSAAVFPQRAARWAALYNEEEAETVTPPTLAEICAADPIFQALQRGDLLWGDIILAEEVHPQREAGFSTVSKNRRARRVHFVDEPPSAMEIAQADAAATAAAEAALWAQPFARNLEARGANWLDLTGLGDADYEALMTWLYGNGWTLSAESRTAVYALPSDEPPRVWVPPSRFVTAASAAAKPLSAPGTDAGRRRAAPRPIFCRAAGTCQEHGCAYVHGDTIPVQNTLCQFGDACSKRVVGPGGTPCTRLHPDEGVWQVGMIRLRP
jgi:hypothetical protein